MANPASNTPDAPARGGRILAIETSDRFGSVALAEAHADGRVEPVAALPLPRDRRSAQTLAPAIRQSLAAAGWAPASLGCVAVARGPGSFTGLRVGVATAKAFAYATGAALVGVDTLEALALPTQAATESAPGVSIWTALEAMRGELFVAGFGARFGAHRGGLASLPTHRRTRGELLASVLPGDWVVGPVAAALAVEAGPNTGVQWRDEEPTAAAVATLAARRWLAGESDDVFALVPAYHRASAAEEKAATREPF